MLDGPVLYYEGANSWVQIKKPDEQRVRNEHPQANDAKEVKEVKEVKN